MFAVRPNTGTFVLYDPVNNVIRTYMTHREGWPGSSHRLKSKGGGLSLLVEEDITLSAERDLLKILIERSEAFLSTLESASSVSNLAPEKCFEACSDMGALSLDVWPALPETEKKKLRVTSQVLASRIEHLPAKRKQEFSACVEAGALEALQRAKHALDELKRQLMRGGLGTSLTGIELNADLFYWREKLAYVLYLSEKQDLRTSPSLREQAERLDAELKRILPYALKIYKSINDDPTPHPERFPTAFWWRQL